MAKSKHKRMTQHQFEKYHRELTEQFLDMLVRPYFLWELELPLTIVATRGGHTRHIRLEQSKELICVTDEGEETELDPFFFFDPREPSDVHVSIIDASGQSIEIPFRLVAENDTPDGHIVSFEVAEGVSPDWQSRSEVQH